jgi:hypothetical protein
MLSAVDYVVWIFSAVNSLLAIGITIRNREATRYLTLNIFLVFSVAISAGQWFVIRAYGLASLEYYYFYYYSDSLSAVLLYFVLMGFYRDVYEEAQTSRRMRLMTIILLAATAWVSFTIVQSNKDRLTTHFVMELGRDLNFLGLLLTYALWWAYMRAPRHSRRLLQAISALGIYFSVFAIYFALRMFTPYSRINRLVPPVLACWLPMAWAYAFFRSSGKAQQLGAVAEPAASSKQAIPSD